MNWSSWWWWCASGVEWRDGRGGTHVRREDNYISPFSFHDSTTSTIQHHENESWPARDNERPSLIVNFASLSSFAIAKKFISYRRTAEWNGDTDIVKIYGDDAHAWCSPHSYLINWIILPSKTRSLCEIRFSKWFQWFHDVCEYLNLPSDDWQIKFSKIKFLSPKLNPNLNFFLQITIERVRNWMKKKENFPSSFMSS